VVAPIKTGDRAEQFLLGARPLSQRDQDAAVVRATGGTHEQGPGDVVVDPRHPLLGTPQIDRVLAGAQQPAVDLADRPVPDDLATGDGRHRLVEHSHALLHATGRDVRLAEQGERIELEVRVAEPPGDAQRRRGDLLALDEIARERRPDERQPAVCGAFLHPFQRALRPPHPTARNGEVAMTGPVQECQPTCRRACLQRLALLAIGGKRALLELDRGVVLAQEVRGVAETVQHVARLVELARLLKTGARRLEVRRRERRLTARQQLLPPGGGRQQGPRC
jgi:hypothetical protein